MTTIAWDGTILAADKRTVNSGLARTTTKLWEEDGMIIAVSGDLDAGMSMRRWLLANGGRDSFPENQKKRDTFATTIVVYEKKLWIYETTPDPFIMEDTIAAFGSGRDFALSALAMQYNAIQAIEFASRFDLYTGNGVDWAEAK
jgi:20S proteasome alpha/beta subunit